MELYIQQHIFTWGDKFSIYDEAGAERYYVEGEVLTLGRKLHLYDMTGRELAYIKQELFTFLPHYKIYIDGVEAAEVIKEFTFFSPEYTVTGPDWTVKGDFFDHDYDVFAGETVVASVEKEWFTLGDAYVIRIPKEGDTVMALATVLVIDACIDAQRN